MGKSQLYFLRLHRTCKFSATQYQFHLIPPGTQLGVNMYTTTRPISRNPSYSILLAGYSQKSRKSARKKPRKENHVRCIQSVLDRTSKLCQKGNGISRELAKTFWYLEFESPTSGKLDSVGEGYAGNKNGRGRKLEFQVKDQFGSLHDGPYLIFRPRGEIWKELDDPPLF
jgi:hypothetical protein